MGFPLEVLEQMSPMQKEIASLRGSQKKTVEPDGQNQIAVFWGAWKDMEEAHKWLGGQLWTAWLPTAIYIYCKGDCNGGLFSQSFSRTQRGEVVGWFRNASVWSKPDRPLHERISQSLVFGTEYLVDKSLWADPGKGLVSFWGKSATRVHYR